MRMKASVKYLRSKANIIPLDFCFNRWSKSENNDWEIVEGIFSHLKLENNKYLDEETKGIFKELTMPDNTPKLIKSMIQNSSSGQIRRLRDKYGKLTFSA